MPHANPRVGNVYLTVTLISSNCFMTYQHKFSQNSPISACSTSAPAAENSSCSEFHCHQLVHSKRKQKTNMAAVAARRLHQALQKCPNFVRIAVQRSCSSRSEDGQAIDEDKKLGGFAKSFQRQFKSQDDLMVPKEPAQDVSFASLLRNCKFVDVNQSFFN